MKSILIAIGVFLCIISPIFPIIGDMIGITFIENIMVAVMLTVIAIAVGFSYYQVLCLSNLMISNTNNAALTTSLPHIFRMNVTICVQFIRCVLSIGVALCVMRRYTSTNN